MFMGALALLLVLASLAQAGTWHLYGCGDTPAGVQSWAEDWSGSGSGEGGSFTSIPSPGCVSPGYLEADLAGSGQPFGADEQLDFEAPDGSDIAGGSLKVGLETEGSPQALQEPLIQLRTDTEGLSPITQCGAYFPGGPPQCPSASFSSPASAYTEQIPGGGATSIYLEAVCGGAGEEGGTCPNDGGTPTAAIKLYGSDIALSTNVVPQIDSVDGGITSTGSVSGESDINVTSSEISGPGIYSVTLAIDGKTIYSGPAAPQDPSCVNVGPQEGEAYGFTSSQPCELNPSTDIPFNTATLPDGTHTVTATVTDASGTVSEPQSTTFTTSNAPTANGLLDIEDTTNQGLFLTGDTLRLDDGGFTVPPGASALTSSYQWYSCASVNAAGDGRGCAAVPGATSEDYVPPASEANDYLYVAETASDGDGSTSLSSPLTPQLTVGPGAPVSPSLCLRAPSASLRLALSRKHGLYLVVRLRTHMGSTSPVSFSLSGHATVISYAVGKIALGAGSGAHHSVGLRGADLSPHALVTVRLRLKHSKRVTTYRVRLPLSRC
jgi:hypothetical protein